MAGLFSGGAIALRCTRTNRISEGLCQTQCCVHVAARCRRSALARVNPLDRVTRRDRWNNGSLHVCSAQPAHPNSLRHFTRRWICRPRRIDSILVCKFSRLRCFWKWQCDCGTKEANTRVTGAESRYAGCGRTMLQIGAPNLIICRGNFVLLVIGSTKNAMPAITANRAGNNKPFQGLAIVS
jgi:hypothetical protein